MTKSTGQRTTFLISYSLLAALVILHLIPLLFPGTRTWGFNQLLFIPETYTYFFIAVSIAVLLLPFLGKLTGLASEIIDFTAKSFFENKHKYYFRVVAVLIFGALFYFLRGKTFFLGDGYNVIANFADKSIPLVKWTEAGTVHLYSFIFDLIGSRTETAVISVFQIVSGLSGMISIWMIFLIAGEATENRLGRFLIALALIFSGVSLMYFGYIEYYPPSWPVIFAFIYFALKELNGRNGLLPAAFFLLIALILHLQSIYFLPAFVYLVLKSKRFSPYYERHRRSILIAIGAAAVVAVGFIIYKYFTSLYIQDIFLPPFTGKPVDRAYAVFSFPHLLDIANELLLLVPLLPLFVYLGFANLRKAFLTDSGRFLLIAALFYLLPLLVIDPKLGMPRDWDLFSIVAIPLVILPIIAIRNRLRGTAGKIIPSLIMLAILLPIPYWAANLSTEPSVRYTRYMVELDVKRAHPTLRSLYLYYQNNGMEAAADSLPFTYAAQNDYADKINIAFRELQKNNFRPAQEFFNRFPADKFDADYHHLKGLFDLKRGRYKTALASLDSAIMLRDQFPVYYHLRAQAYAALKELDKAAENLRRAYRLDPDRGELISGLAGIYIANKQYDSSIYYAGRLAQLDSTNPVAYLILAKAYALKGDKADAVHNLRKYSEAAGDDQRYADKARDVALLISRMK